MGLPRGDAETSPFWNWPQPAAAMAVCADACLSDRLAPGAGAITVAVKKAKIRFTVL